VKVARMGGSHRRARSGQPLDLRDVKLVLVAPVLDFGGVESRIVIQCRLMSEEFGELRVCSLSGDGHAAGQARDLGISVDVLGIDPALRNPRAMFALWRYLRAHQPDIVHATTGAMTINAVGAAFLAGVPIRIAEEVGIPRRGRLGRRIFPLAYRAATVVVGVSDAVVRYLIQNDGVPESKAVRIYNTADDSYFRLQRPSVRAGGPIRVVSVGRLVPDKAYDILLRASQRAILNGSMVLCLVGDGPLRVELEELASALDISAGVTFLGRSDDVAGELTGADIFVLPSRSEGLPLALVEAMAARLPVIATAVGGIPEILGDSTISNWMVPPDDAAALENALFRMVALSEHERADLGEQAHRIATDGFGQERYKSELLQLYAAALAHLNRA
jgi:glycosyltransferase involved in cell wall biosynthesis